MKNVIILTGGLAGSSVLTSLLNQAGYWVGDNTIKKEKDYDTLENAELVRLNRQILQESGFTGNWIMEFHPEYMDTITRGFERLDPTPYRAFVEKCSEHQPWIWKDPRLWLTMRYWIRFLDRDNLSFLTIHREDTQAWISSTIRRQIQSPDHARFYREEVMRTIYDFLGEERLAYQDVLYEDLLTKPEQVIQQISDLTGAPVGMDNFRAVFRGKLGGRQHGLKNWLLAWAIYLKNFDERYRVTAGRSVPPKNKPKKA